MAASCAHNGKVSLQQDAIQKDRVQALEINKYRGVHEVYALVKGCCFRAAAHPKGIISQYGDQIRQSFPGGYLFKGVGSIASCVNAES